MEGLQVIKVDLPEELNKIEIVPIGECTQCATRLEWEDDYTDEELLRAVGTE